MAESPPASRPSLLRNWISAVGLIVAGSSLFAVVCLMAMDFFAHFSNPSRAIRTYFVAPAFLIAGILLTVVGVVRQRRRRATFLLPVIDWSNPQHRKALGSMAGFGAFFLLLTAIGSYRSYHFTESKQFCGQTCFDSVK